MPKTQQPVSLLQQQKDLKPRFSLQGKGGHLLTPLPISPMNSAPVITVLLLLSPQLLDFKGIVYSFHKNTIRFLQTNKFRPD